MFGKYNQSGPFFGNFLYFLPIAVSTTIKCERWSVRSDDLEGYLFTSNFWRGRRGEEWKMEEGKHQEKKTLKSVFIY